MVAAATAKKDSLLSSRDVDKKSPPRLGTTRQFGIAHPQNALSIATANVLSDPASTVQQPPDKTDTKDIKPTSNAEAAQPLAPPPRPAPVQQQQNPTDTPDYFSSVHNNSHYSLEPNLFEQSFGNPSTETPGKSILPPLASLTSPAPLTGNPTLGGVYNWTNSLRSGPLSPAMLSGPTAVTGDYFDSHIRGGFPTPNESSLRTGLTPGGGGSMFPAPSPGSQAFINSLASGGATPSTLEFHRTALSARQAEIQSHKFTNGASTQAQEHRAQVASMDPAAQQQSSHQHFGQHDSDAANGLYLLAQAGNESQPNNQFAIPNQPAHGMNMGGHQQENSPNISKRTTRTMTGSLGGSISGSVQDHSEMSGDVSEGVDQSKPNTRAKSKKASGGKTTNTRRKADETPSKPPANKKTKTNNANANDNMNMDMSMDGLDSDEEATIKEEQYHENGKKMTDEEKRKNFLERNRYRCTSGFER